MSMMMSAGCGLTTSSFAVSTPRLAGPARHVDVLQVEVDVVLLRVELLVRGDRLQHEVTLSTALRAVDLRHPAPRQAASGGQVDLEHPGRQPGHLVVLVAPLDRVLTVFLVKLSRDLSDRRHAHLPVKFGPPGSLRLDTLDRLAQHGGALLAPLAAE